MMRTVRHVKRQMTEHEKETFQHFKRIRRELLAAQMEEDEKMET